MPTKSHPAKRPKPAAKSSKKTRAPKQTKNKFLLGRPALLSVTALAFVALFAIVGFRLHDASLATSGPHQIKSAVPGNWCMNNSGGNSYAAQNPINVKKCDGEASEDWDYTGGELKLDADSSSGNGTRCAQPRNGGTGAQTEVVLDQCTSAKSMKWTETGGGFKNTNSGRYLTIPSADTSRALQIRDNATKNKDQNWSVGNAPSTGGGGGGGSSSSCSHLGSTNEKMACAQIKSSYKSWANDSEYLCLNELWNAESGWNQRIMNPAGEGTGNGAFGIAQALHHGGSNTAAHDSLVEFPGGARQSLTVNEYPTQAANAENASAQITWGLAYIKSAWHTPCAAEANEIAHHWYGKYQAANGTIEYF